jgi:anti-sigma factor RsiW
MRCRKWAIEISKWHEGELAPDGEARLLRHLETCPHCRALEARLRTVRGVLKESPELPVPEFLSGKITASVTERMRERSESKGFRILGFLSYHTRLVPTAVLIAGLCIGGLAGLEIARFMEVRPYARSCDLLTFGGIGAQGESHDFSFIWQVEGKGGRQ